MPEVGPRDPRRDGGAAAARLKEAIDSGRTGDKVPGFDPAAAPLGTDEEAAGAVPPPGGRPAVAARPPASVIVADPSGGNRAQDRLVWPAILAGAAVTAAVVAAVAWFVG